ncbi:hypothetical protein [Leptothoe sp. PORK10 BA2]|uniref:hypothetical protein n=1 Tax=Leptothoe sp. PORK10 BA2 TaxID=3110254 RepID=UPI002B211366|nr:hypothetical protein [Leptothoe sp. PORK10 BA2]MEA5463120.1 hypothetical protein [Leptothoe sp. PORK10 BA2]
MHLPPMMAPTPHHPVNTPTLALSVSDFFSQINWYGQRALDQEDEDGANTPYETVGQFFNTFPWQGSVPAIPPDDWELFHDDEVTNPMEDDTLTLEDLSALF